MRVVLYFLAGCTAAICCGTRFGIMMVCALCVFGGGGTSVSNVAVRLAVKTLHDLALVDVAFN